MKNNKKKTSTLAKLIIVNGSSGGITLVVGTMFGPLGIAVAGFGWAMGAMAGASSVLVSQDEEDKP